MPGHISVRCDVDWLLLLFVSLCSVQFILAALEELRRARNVMIGVNLALAMDEFKSCLLIPAIAGTVKGMPTQLEHVFKAFHRSTAYEDSVRLNL